MTGGPTRNSDGPSTLQAPEDESKPPADRHPAPAAVTWAVEELLIDDAKQAVGLVVQQINPIVGHQVAKLIGDEGGPW
ncbi:hypothetical protein ACFCXA_19300 [Streptomyces virginiae]|uniref:hypothetical protein n=1 Tax=Streptomyces virginiae TaxID=1961 RepID=UPI0035DF0A6D